jgi:hypothetical protein
MDDNAAHGESFIFDNVCSRRYALLRTYGIFSSVGSTSDARNQPLARTISGRRRQSYEFARGRPQPSWLGIYKLVAETQFICRAIL